MPRTLTIVALILVLAGCGGSDPESSDAQTTTETTQTIVSNDNPLACLEEAGLSNVEEREVGFWRGLHESPGFAIVVHKLRKPAKAPIVVAGDVRRDGIVQGRGRGHRATELGTRRRFSGARGRGLPRRLAPHLSPQRADGVGGVLGLMPLPCSPLYAPVADSIYHRGLTGLRVVSIFTM